jgi:hypothetical protein
MAVESLKVLTLATVVLISAQDPAPDFLYILKPVSLLELSFHLRLTIVEDIDVAVKFDGAGGVPESPVFADTQLE